MATSLSIALSSGIVMILVILFVRGSRTHQLWVHNLIECDVCYVTAGIFLSSIIGLCGGLLFFIWGG